MFPVPSSIELDSLLHFFTASFHRLLLWQAHPSSPIKCSHPSSTLILPPPILPLPLLPTPSPLLPPIPPQRIILHTPPYVSSRIIPSEIHPVLQTLNLPASQLLFFARSPEVAHPHPTPSQPSCPTRSHNHPQKYINFSPIPPPPSCATSAPHIGKYLFVSCFPATSPAAAMPPSAPAIAAVRGPAAALYITPVPSPAITVFSMSSVAL